MRKIPILNYSTTVAIEKSIGEVTSTLARRGVTRISTAFDNDGAPSGLGFTMVTDYGPRDFELPVNVDGVLAMLKKEAEPRYRTREQAARVAWRIAKDWMEAQVALIEAGLATLDEVMLPWMVGAGGKTVYDAIRAQGLAEIEGRTK